METNNQAVTEMPAFVGFPKMGRFSRECIITEKIDGTNAQILITDSGQMMVGSRTRWITPKDDNFGFANWVEANKDELMKLGPGQHFGEWWGGKIQRGYGIKEKRFSLFNVSRWDDKLRDAVKYPTPRPACCGVVPTLFVGSFDAAAGTAAHILGQLTEKGSVAAPGFMCPEGIVIYHTAANMAFKKTIKDDGVPKSLANAKTK
jgi:hypothetical protein